MVEKSPPSSLTYVITWTLIPCFASKSFTYKTMAFHMYLQSQTNLKVMWQGSHLSFKKRVINTKVLTLLNDTHKSKVTMHVWHESKVANTDVSMMFFAILGKRSFFNYHFNGKLKWELCPNINFIKNGASINDNGKRPLTINNPKSSLDWIWWRSFLL